MLPTCGSKDSFLGPWSKEFSSEGGKSLSHCIAALFLRNVGVARESDLYFEGSYSLEVTATFLRSRNIVQWKW